MSAFCAYLITPTVFLAILASSCSGSDSASDPGSGESYDLSDALVHGTPMMMARYRYENVDQHNIPDQAHASTLRLALGYQTKPYCGFSAAAEYQGVFEVGNALYDDQPGYQGSSRYPLVNDPAGSELDQAYVQYATPAAPAQVTIKAGRQEILLNNQRIIGNAGWRQTWQSFDAVTAQIVSNREYSLTAGAIATAYRVSGNDAINLGGTAAAPTPSANDGTQQMDSWFANAGYQRASTGSAALYAVCLNYALPQSKGNNSATIGARGQGPYEVNSEWSIVYALEAARQTNYAHYQAAGISTYTAWYYQSELGAKWKGITAKAGWSLLQGSSAGDKFNTPLDSPHAFNGWAEQFVATPNLGLDARSVSLSGPLPAIRGLSMVLVGYQFYSQSGHFHYGDEVDLMLEYVMPSIKDLVVGTQIGAFREDVQKMVPVTLGGGPVDATKISLYSVFQL